ncbi:MAG: hypothetical protein HOQ45_04930 [Nocardioidaceae bacterium]|nr:hypothetical protein [Nocardioidaceae bacterium]
MNEVRPEGDGEIPPELVGTWEIVRYDDRERETEEWQPAFRGDMRGVVTYHRTGLWTVQVYAGPLDLYDAAYVGYFGTATLHEGVREAGVVRGNLVVDVLGASNQEALTYAGRPVEIDGDTLLIGNQLTWVREGRRLR